MAILNRQLFSSIRSSLNSLLSAAASYVTLTGTQTLTNKTLTSPTINTPTLTVNDDSFTVQDNSDTTKKMVFQLSGITTATTRTVTMPDASFTIVGDSTTSTLTNKTYNLANNTTTGTIAEFNSACSDADFATLAGTENLTNKTLDTPTLKTPKIQDSGADHVYNLATNDLAADRTITLPLLTGNDVFVFADHAQILKNKSLVLPQIEDTSLDHQYIFAVNELTGDRTIALPLLTGNDTFVFEAHAQTLTNKTVNLANNTVTGTAAEFDTACSDDNFAYQSDLTNKQDASAISTLHWRVDPETGNVQINAANQVNNLYVVTNSGATTFDLAGTSGATTFPVGGVVGVYNTNGSSNDVTIQGGSGVTVTSNTGALTVGNNRVAWVQYVTTNVWHRLF